MKEIKLLDEELLIVIESLKNYVHLSDTLEKLGFDSNLSENGKTCLDNAIKKMAKSYDE